MSFIDRKVAEGILIGLFLVFSAWYVIKAPPVQHGDKE
jgi:hypothetical protein